MTKLADMIIRSTGVCCLDKCIEFEEPIPHENRLMGGGGGGVGGGGRYINKQKRTKWPKTNRHRPHLRALCFMDNTILRTYAHDGRFVYRCS